MWRFGYVNPINYNDNEVFCGGAAVQFEASSLFTVAVFISTVVKIMLKILIIENLYI